MDNTLLTWEEKLQRDALIAAFRTWCTDCGVVAEIASSGELVLIEQSLTNEDELIETVIQLDRYEA